MYSVDDREEGEEKQAFYICIFGSQPASSVSDESAHT